jgi:hypothetical protein
MTTPRDHHSGASGTSGASELIIYAGALSFSWDFNMQMV